MYAISIVLLVGAGVAFAWAARTFLDSLWLLWLSMGLSAMAFLAAVASVRLPRAASPEDGGG